MEDNNRSVNQRVSPFLSEKAIRRESLDPDKVEKAFDRMKRNLEKLYESKRITQYPE